MRLSEPGICDGLMHPNVIVRGVVVKYFSRSKRVQADMTRKVIQAVDQFGWKDAFRWPHEVCEFALDEELMLWALEQIDRTDRDAPSRNTRHHLARMVSSAPVDALIAHTDQIFGNDLFVKQLSPRIVTLTPAERIRQRIQVSEQTAETCWNDLLQHCESLDSVKDFDDANIPWCEILIERIADDLEFATSRQDEISRILTDTEVRFDDTSCWLVGVMITLAGQMRLEAAVPDLYRHYETDWDWFSEEITGALIRIGTENVQRHVADHYPEKPWYVRLYSSSIFEDIHTDSVLTWLCPLIELEQDDGLRAELGVASASHFDDVGIDIARSVFLEDPEDPEREPIIERLVAFAHLADLDLPERESWERYLNQRWHDFNKRDKDLERLLRQPKKIREARQADAHRSPGTTIYNDTNKPGRNSRCPCGSGKKYKKCCLKKAQP